MGSQVGRMAKRERSTCVCEKIRGGKELDRWRWGGAGMEHSDLVREAESTRKLKRREWSMRPSAVGPSWIGWAFWSLAYEWRGLQRFFTGDAVMGLRGWGFKLLWTNCSLKPSWNDFEYQSFQKICVSALLWVLLIQNQPCTENLLKIFLIYFINEINYSFRNVIDLIHFSF